MRQPGVFTGLNGGVGALERADKRHNFRFQVFIAVMDERGRKGGIVKSANATLDRQRPVLLAIVGLDHRVDEWAADGVEDVRVMVQRHHPR